MTFSTYDDYVELIKPFIGQVAQELLATIEANPGPADLVQQIQSGNEAEKLAAYIALAERLLSEAEPGSQAARLRLDGLLEAVASEANFMDED
jgi:hypothetical protein